MVGISKKAQQKIVLQCLPAMNQDGRSLVMQPIDRRFPQMEVFNDQAKQPPVNQLFDVEFDAWVKQSQLPSGRIVKVGELLHLDDLNKICDFTLMQAGIPYMYPN